MALRRSLRRVARHAAFASAFLGMLCVLGELCFLLPDLLVTPEALPFYKAHIGVFRSILQGSIFTAIATGALSIVLYKPTWRSLLGIALGVVALLMGGAGAEAIDLGGRRSFFAGLDYFVLELLVLGLVFVPLETLFPLRDFPSLREGWQTDLKHFFVSHAGVQLLSFGGMIPRAAHVPVPLGRGGRLRTVDLEPGCYNCRQLYYIDPTPCHVPHPDRPVAASG